MSGGPPTLQERRAGVLFRLSAAGTLDALNEPGNPPAPRLWVGRDASGVTVRVRTGLPQEMADELVRLAAASGPWSSGEPTPARSVEALARLLETAAPVEAMYQGPVFTVPLPYFPSIGALQLYPANATLLHPSLATLTPELRHVRPIYAVLRDGQAVSVCYSARTGKDAAEAGVETAQEYRGQGCAGLAINAWAAAVREAGRTPLYSTSWENAASLAVARKLELEEAGEDLWFS